MWKFTNSHVSLLSGLVVAAAARLVGLVTSEELARVFSLGHVCMSDLANL